MACWSIRRARPCGHRNACRCQDKGTHGGGWTLAAPQKWWGHKAEKASWFYVVGCEPQDVPAIPLILGDAAYVVQSRKREDYRPHITKAEREHTPEALAVWLVELARRCGTKTIEVAHA